MWGFLLIKIAGALTAQPHGFQPPPQGMGRDWTVVLATQMRRQQFHTPHRRPVAQLEGIASQMLEDMGGRHPGRGHGTSTPWGIGQGGYLMARQIALEPVVDGLFTDARQLRDLADRFSLGHP